MAVSLRKFQLLILHVLVLQEMMGMLSEAALCEGRSTSFRGSCFRSNNCATICETEGFINGLCKFFKCICSKDCNTAGSGRGGGGSGGSGGGGGPPGGEGPPGGSKGPPGGDEGPPEGPTGGVERPPGGGPATGVGPPKGDEGPSEGPSDGGERPSGEGPSPAEG